MTNADLPEKKITPILLPNKIYYTTLLIKDVHKENFHAGVSHILVQIRSKYWLPQGQAQVKKVLVKGLTCIKRQ